MDELVDNIAVKVEVDYSKWIDPDIQNTLILNFKMRAMCELINSQKGMDATRIRTEKTLGDINVSVLNHSIKTMNDKKQMMYSAKTVAVGNVSLIDIFKIAPKCVFNDKQAPGGLTKNRLQISVKDHKEIVEVLTAKMFYSTATFAADIDIIPEIANNISKEYLIANKDKIAEIMSLRSSQLAAFVDMIMKEIPPKMSTPIVSDVLQYLGMRNKEGVVLKKAVSAFNHNYKDVPGLIAIFNILLRTLSPKTLTIED